MNSEVQTLTYWTFCVSDMTDLFRFDLLHFMPFFVTESRPVGTLGLDMNETKEIQTRMLRWGKKKHKNWNQQDSSSICEYYLHSALNVSLFHWCISLNRRCYTWIFLVLLDHTTRKEHSLQHKILADGMAKEECY